MENVYYRIGYVKTNSEYNNPKKESCSVYDDQTCKIMSNEFRNFDLISDILFTLSH